jgi:hypothetical protein
MPRRNVRTSVNALPTLGGIPVPPDLDRLAHCVASGMVPFPADLSPYETGILVDLVRQRLRERLVGHIAQAIAADIVASTRNENQTC